mmetsp:Transcript_51602/g.105037  ORF Transcript_51602/g.105037 Transcript_51602/m.105037 type:complete len:283 (-) Transcript_51602:81-929(-)
MPHQDVSVQARAAVRPRGDPVVVVRRASVVADPPVWLVPADAHQEHRPVLLAQEVLALLGGRVRVGLPHLVGGGEVDLLGQDRLVRKLLRHCLLRFVDRLVDALDGVLKSLDSASVGRDPLLPVELVHVQRVGEVHVVVASKAAEIRHQTLPIRHFVVVKSPALPLGKRERHLKGELVEVPRREARGTLDAVKVVVEARALVNEHRCTNALQIGFLLEAGLECALHQQEGILQVAGLLDDGSVSSALKHVRWRQADLGCAATERNEGSSCQGGIRKSYTQQG